MSARTHTNPARRRETGAGAEGPWIALGLVLVGVVVLVGAVLTAAAAGGADVADPGGYLVGLATGRTSWPGVVATLALVALVIGLIVVPILGWRLLRRRDRRWLPKIDPKAASMATPTELAGLLPRGAAADAVRLGGQGAGTGTPIGQLVPRWQPLRSSYEWVQAWIMGPRSGKTTCVVARQLCETAGPVVATSNKRDIVDLTRLSRMELGHCWVFDPQDLTGEPPTWWWNPLSYVTAVDKADELAGLFAASSVTDDGARSDAYFEPEAMNYLANLLLAAAVDNAPITVVYEWMNDPADRTPIDVLEAGGHPAAATALDGISYLADGQRDGVIGTARKMVAWLRNPAILRWIAPLDVEDIRPQFDPATFVTTRQTLYLISREGDGSARAVTAALAVATMRAGETLAARSPHGRLPTPMQVVLDEAANVVRWKHLPDMYSHFGSRGIVLSSFFQSWAQGCRAYGEAGMKTLWSAANIRVVGSGLAEDGFLDTWSKLIGDHDVVTKDRSVGPIGRDRGLFGGRTTTSTRLRRERIFEPAELATLPPSRAVLLASGSPPALIRLVHWSEAPYAATVAESLAHFGSASRRPAATSPNVPASVGGDDPPAPPRQNTVPSGGDDPPAPPRQNTVPSGGDDPPAPPRQNTVLR